jgi:hypothetical protein
MSVSPLTFLKKTKGYEGRQVQILCFNFYLVYTEKDFELNSAFVQKNGNKNIRVGTKTLG